jgi:hypothetical protein
MILLVVIFSSITNGALKEGSNGHDIESAGKFHFFSGFIVCIHLKILKKNY